jgi:hypothetical protein
MHTKPLPGTRIFYTSHNPNNRDTMNALASQLRFRFFGTDDAIPAPPSRSPASKLQDGKAIKMGAEIFNEENEIKVINEKEECPH